MDIQDLKKIGWDIDVIHERRFNLIHKVNGIKKEIRSRGGRTTVILTNSNHQVFSGTAICSDNDNYCKSTGRTIALARALVQIPAFRNSVPNLFVK